MIGATTKVFAVIGDPIEHSLSPALQNAAFELLGADAVYVAFRVAKGQGKSAIDAMVGLGISGFNVTMPLKEELFGLCEKVSNVSKLLGVVNTVWLDDDGQVSGDSTDGDGFILALENAGVGVLNKRVLVLGGGGAAKSIVHALWSHQANVSVAARRRSQAELVAGLVSDCQIVDWEVRNDVLGDIDIVVNATPVGMKGEEPHIQLSLLPKHALVVDTIYSPPQTPLLRAARSEGLNAMNGIGLLVGQGILSCEHFVGKRPEFSDILNALDATFAGPPDQ